MKTKLNIFNFSPMFHKGWRESAKVQKCNVALLHYCRIAQSRAANHFVRFAAMFLMLMTMSIGQVWAWNAQFNGGNILFDNSQTQWGDYDVNFVWGNDGAYYKNKMSAIENTQLYRWSGTCNWGKVYLCFFHGNWGAPGEDQKAYSNISSHASSYSAQYNSNYTFNSGSIYLFTTGGGDKGCSISPNYKSSYSELNTTQKLSARVSVDDGAYSAPSINPATLTVTGKAFDAWNTCNTSKNSSKTAGASYESPQASIGYTATTTMTVSNVVENYTFVGFYDAETGGTLLSSETTYAYTTREAKTVYARFTYTTPSTPTHSVSYTAQGTGWTYGGTRPTTVEEGQNVSFTVTPATGYTVNVTASGASLTKNGNTYSFTMGTSNVTITVTATETSYTVNVAAGAGGTVSPASVTAKVATKSVEITATPNTGYSFVNWTLPSGVTAADGYTANSNPIKINATAASKTITANFAQEVCVYVLKSLASGFEVPGVTFSDHTTYKYQLWAWDKTGDSKFITSMTSYPGPNPSGTYTDAMGNVWYKFVKNNADCADDYAVHLTYNGTQIFNSESSSSLVDGSAATKWAFTANTSAWFVPGTSTSANSAKGYTSNPVRALVTYTVTISNGDHGTVSLTGAQTVGAAGLDLTVTPAAGYVFNGWNTTGGASMDGNHLTATADGTVTATYRAAGSTKIYFYNDKDWSTVKVHKWGGSGSATSWPGVAADLESITHDGHKIYSVTITEGEYTTIIFNNGNGTQTDDIGELLTHSGQCVRYKGSEKQWEWIALPTQNYKIVYGSKLSVTNSYASGSYVDAGTELTFTAATPDAGYAFAGFFSDSGKTQEITGAGVDKANRTYTVTLNSNVEVHAKYTEVGYTVTIAAGANGSVSPSGDQTVGISGIAVTATPDSHYAFDNWAVDGGAVVATASEASTTITATANGTVTANFKPSWDLRGFGGDWTTANAKKFTVWNGNEATVDVELTAGNHTFKVHHYSGTEWYGNNGTMTRGNSSEWTMTSDAGNCTITADIAGTYTFKFNADTKKLTVTYPAVSEFNVTLAATAGGAVRFDGTTDIAAGSSTTVQVGALEKAIVATPASGYTFARWEVTGTTANVTVNHPENASTHMTASGTGATVTAKFTPNLHTTWFLTGSFNEWSKTANELMMKESEFGVKTVGYTTVHLSANTEFKIYHDGLHYANENHATTMTMDNCTGWTFENTGGNNNNTTLSVTEEGDYVFEWDYTTHKLTVHYPVNMTLSASRTTIVEGDKITLTPRITGYQGDAYVCYAVTSGTESAVEIESAGDGKADATFSTRGSYTIEATLHTTADCTSEALATATVDITVNPNQKVTISVLDEGGYATHIYMWKDGQSSINNGVWPGQPISEQPDYRTFGAWKIFTIDLANGFDRFKLSQNGNPQMTSNWTIPTVNTCYEITYAGVNNLNFDTHDCPEGTFLVDGFEASYSVLTGGQVRIDPLFTFMPGVDFDDLTITITGNNTSVATVNKFGQSIIIAGVDNGTTSATISYSDGSNTINKTISISVGGAITIEAKIADEDTYWIYNNIVHIHYWYDGGSGDQLMTFNAGVFSATIPMPQAVTNFIFWYGEDIKQTESDAWRKTGDITGVTTGGCYTITHTAMELIRGAVRDGDRCSLNDTYQVEIQMNNGKTFYSNAVSSTDDILSFFAPKDGDGTYTGGTVRLIKNGQIAATLTGFSQAGVYVAKVNAAGNALTDVTLYEGNYYVFSDLSTHERGETSEMTFFNRRPNETYSYYWTAFTGDDNSVNVIATVANEYNNSLSVRIEKDKLTDDSGNVYKGNVRFSYEPSTNEFRRAVIAGSTISDQFLNIYGESENLFTDAEKTTPMDEYLYTHDPAACKFIDLSDWVYEITATAVVTNKAAGVGVVVNANFNGQTQYLLGYQIDPETGEETVEPKPLFVLGTGTDLGEYTIRIIYDFKRNRLIAAWEPDEKTYDESLNINADVMFISTEGSDVKQVVMGEDVQGHSVELTSLQKVMYVLELNRDDVTKSGTFWFALPFNCLVSDIMGVEGFGTKWRIMRYDGERRAQIGWFKETSTFWTAVGLNETLHEGEGYLIQVQRNKLPWKEIAGKSTTRFYFPSAEDGFTMNSSGIDKTITYANHECTIITPDDRRAQDSNWKLIGPLSYNNVTVKTTTPGSDGEHSIDKHSPLQFLYTYDPTQEAGKRYIVQDVVGEKFTLHSFHSYMVQFAGDITWSQYTQTETAPGVLAAMPRRSAMADNSFTQTTIGMELLDANWNMMDKTFVRLDEKATSGFDQNLDLTKIMDSSKPQVYTIADGIEYAGNSVALTVDTVPVVVNVPNPGEFVITMPRANDDIEPMLYDAQLGITTPLNIQDYSVTLPAGKSEGRFFLVIGRKSPTITTTIENVNAADLNLPQSGTEKLMINGMLYILRDGCLYDAVGRKVK